jgi:ubiquinone/menaquinone biosynthesis C-methylase UbiE
MAEQAFRFVDSAAYERFIGRWSRAVAPKFLEWLAVPAGARWLDAGCGTGIQAETILQQCAPASVHASDIEPGQVEAAARGWAKGGAQFEVADVCKLPYADASFDVVASALLINFVPQPLEALREMARVVRPGGVVAGFVWDLRKSGHPAVRFGARCGRWGWRCRRSWGRKRRGLKT